MRCSLFALFALHCGGILHKFGHDTHSPLLSSDMAFLPALPTLSRSRCFPLRSSVLLLQDKTPISRTEEVFGPVTEPLYAVLDKPAVCVACASQRCQTCTRPEEALRLHAFTTAALLHGASCLFLPCVLCISLQLCAAAARQNSYWSH
jgi:hypothetical protein